MKLKEALKIGIDCGLETARECIRNIDLHAGMFFSWDMISMELDDLYTEAEELVSETNFTMDDSAKVILDWLNIEDDGIDTRDLPL